MINMAVNGVSVYILFFQTKVCFLCDLVSFKSKRIVGSDGMTNKKQR